MKQIGIVPIGNVARDQLEILTAELGSALNADCAIVEDPFEASFAYDPLRGQYHSTAILRRIHDRAAAGKWRMLGVTEVDLFIPIFTFVFGEAQLGPNQATSAVVSLHRLRQEFYGLPPNNPLLTERLIKESLHELGHTVGLRHCRNYRCVMSSSPSVEYIDLKSAEFCAHCVAAFPEIQI